MGFLKRVKNKLNPKSAEEVVNGFDTESFYLLVLKYNAVGQKPLADELNISDLVEFRKAIEKRLVQENLKLISSTDDDEILKKLASSDSRPLFSIDLFQDARVRTAAIRKVGDIDFLIDMSTSIRDLEIFDEILKRIDDDSILFDITMNSDYDMTVRRWERDVSKRVMAAEKITDENLLAKLIEGSNYSRRDIAIAAAKNIKNQDLSVDLILNNELDLNILDSMLGDLSDDKLDEIIKKSDRNVKSRAMKHVSSQDLLLEYSSDKNSSIREFAVENIENQDVLEKIAKTDDISNVRASAVKNIRDQKVLESIVKADDSDDVRISAIRNSITDSGLLKELCLGDKSENVRKEALYKISDDNILAEIALTTDDSSIRYKAIHKIQDETVLAWINREIPLKSCPECGSFKVEYTDFYDPTSDYFVSGNRCRSCGHSFNKTMQ